MPSDPGGVLAALPASLRALYNGYPTGVYKSAFAGWKPASAANKTVGFLLSETNNGYQLGWFSAPTTPSTWASLTRWSAPPRPHFPPPTSTRS